MRQLAAFRFDTDENAEQSQVTLASIENVVDAWLHSKGHVDLSNGTLTLYDGRVASISRTALSTAQGTLRTIAITEPTAGASFRSEIVIVQSAGTLSFSCTLSAATPEFAPTSIAVRRPRLIADLLALPTTWRLRGSALTAAKRTFRGSSGGDAFVSLVWDTQRAVPVVAISDEYGAVLHPGVVEAIASDLTGIAVVAELDVDASWRLTARKGREWSCFGGAIRVYWPFGEQNQAPYRHPLWTPQRLLNDASDTESAAERIREQLRRRVFAQAAFAVTEPPLADTIRAAARSQELNAIRSRIDGTANYEALANEYFETAARLAGELEERDAVIRDLRNQLESARLALLFTTDAPTDLPPVTIVPPATVEEAALEAMERFADTLTFGSDVNRGIERIARDAGPPEKVLDYLDILSQFTLARRGGSLGDTAVRWINAKGAVCSGESETIRNSAASRRERTWDDGAGSSRYFDLHLKPADQTSPDRCVRIYFEYDEQTQKTIVAWIGRKPGL